MRYFQFLKDRPIIVSNDLFYYLKVEWRFWADLASQITMILFVKLTEAFPSPLITFCLRVIASPRNSATGYILKTVKILVFKKGHSPSCQPLYDAKAACVIETSGNSCD